jgi:hypothetical protein
MHRIERLLIFRAVDFCVWLLTSMAHAQCHRHYHHCSQYYPVATSHTTSLYINVSATAMLCRSREVMLVLSRLCAGVLPTFAIKQVQRNNGTTTA